MAINQLIAKTDQTIHNLWVIFAEFNNFFGGICSINYI